MPFEAITWVDSDEDKTALHSGEIKALVNKSGFEAPKYTHNIIKSPGRPGAILSFTTVEPRVISIPIFIQAQGNSAVEAIISNLRSSLRPNALGRLEWITDNNSGRRLNCLYQSGLEGNDALAMRYDNWAKFTLNFLALDPFFYDLAETIVEYTLGASADDDFLGDPFFPLRINPSTVFTSPTIINLGDEDIYPVWTLEGPGDDIYLINNTTSKTIALTSSGGLVLAMGDQTQIDTQFGAKTVTNLITEANQFSYLSKASEFWPLVPGSNQVSIQVNSATVDTKVTLTYRGSYLGVSSS